jgi:hypothetical protein
MGLSIHYQGKLKDYALIDEIMEETADVCASMGWEYHLMQPDNKKNNNITQPVKYTPEDVKGITFSPADCEPVILTFLPDATLVNWVKLINYDHLTNNLAIEWVHTKTQFSGPDTHMAVLKFLHYLSKKYFSFFELKDEGDYWGKWDVKVLLAQFGRYNFLMNAVANALEEVKANPEETPGMLASKIEEILKKKFEGGKFDPER